MPYWLGTASKVDILIDFVRYEDNEQTTKRRLSCLSRFEETPRELVIDYVNDDYIVLGSSADVREKEKLADLLSIFSAYPNGFTVKEVWDNWDTFEHGKKLSKRTIQRYIAKLIEAKQVEKQEDKEIGGKLVPVYIVIDPRQESNTRDKTELSQVIEAESQNMTSKSEATDTRDKITEGIDITKNVA